jgi:hypothetical protein
MTRQREKRAEEFRNEYNKKVGKTDDEFDYHLSDKEITKIKIEAADKVMDDITEEWAQRGDQSLNSNVTDAPIFFNKSKDTSEVDLHDWKDAIVDGLESNYDQAKAVAQRSFEESTDKAGAAVALQARLTKLWNEKEAAKRAYYEGYDEALETQVLMRKRLEEQMLLSAIDTSERIGKTSLRLNVAGGKLVDIPLPETMFRATQAFSDGPVINKAISAWAEAFHPASKLAPEINKARLHAQSLTPQLIKQHIMELDKTFRGIKPRTRSAQFKTLRRTGSATTPVGKKIASEFAALVPYFSGEKKVGELYLTAGDINKYLPNDFQLVDPKGVNINRVPITKGKDIVDAMRRMPEGTDPMKALWQLRVGVEKAQADMATRSTLINTFGIEREMQGLRTEQGKLIEQLHDAHGYVTIRELGERHYFDPETAGEIRKLMDMMKPQNTPKIMQVYDKAIHFWKSTVTVYNPGYYTRNAIGEVLMGLFDGLSNPKYYGQAARVLKHTRPDATKQALMQLEPWAAHVKTRNPGRAVVAKLRNGTKITVDDADVLFTGSGLKSGFVSTEFDHVFPMAGSVRASLPGRGATAVNDWIRGKGEKFEDYFRMAHFLYRLEKAPRGLKIEEAADWASNYVRKYHFDYTDFTPFEKTTMMRIFPFYKWTRKAFPLMASMLFTKPGNAIVYPKIMQNMSYATGGTDVMKDMNGVLPNYDEEAYGVVPEWMQSFMAYPMGGPDEQGAQNFMNVATPSLDIYKQVSNPISAAIGMLSPGIKVPLEQASGSTLDPNFDIPLNYKWPNKKKGIEVGDPDWGARIDHLLRTTPITNLGRKTIQAEGMPGDLFGWKGNPKKTDNPLLEPGGGLDEVLLSWLTGAGMYENNKDRQEQAKRFGN